MTSRQRIAVGAVGLVILILVGVVFREFIATEIIAPLALLAWLLLRIFILSIAQKTYWYGAAFVVMLSLFRLWPSRPRAAAPETLAGSNVAVKGFERWRSLLTLSDHDAEATRNVRWELVRLLLSLYATERHAEADLKLHEALQRREIELPEAMHAFLFPVATAPVVRSWPMRALNVWRIPLDWARRRAARKAATLACQQRIDDVLCFLENSLEMNDDHDDDCGRKLPPRD